MSLNCQNTPLLIRARGGRARLPNNFWALRGITSPEADLRDAPGAARVFLVNRFVGTPEGGPEHQPMAGLGNELARPLRGPVVTPAGGGAKTTRVVRKRHEDAPVVALPSARAGVGAQERHVACDRCACHGGIRI